ncbi:unnamed protein product [Brassica rapa]|uniref:Uncharacterized protein n=1 Tax=Brassica campestris TaxID=3711 RepID=A0A3P5Z009_BRACM|nr:unnamed protein product [Brassica rapa]VDC67213.1 unnamed protein product [Brassica rapa]
MLSDIYRHSCYHGLNGSEEERASHVCAAAGVRPGQLGSALGSWVSLVYRLLQHQSSL